MGVELQLREKVYHLQDRIRTLARELDQERVSRKILEEDLSVALDKLSNARALMVLSFLFGVAIASIAWIVR